MIVVAFLVLVVVGAVVLGAGALASDDGERRRPVGERLFGGTGPALGLLAVLGVLVVVLVVLPLLTFGLRGAVGDDDGDAPAGAGAADADDEPTTTTARATARTVPAAPTPPTTVARRGGEAVVAGLHGPEVRISAAETAGFPPPPATVDELAAGTVLRIWASGFPPDITGDVVQCLDGDDGITRCRNSFPVRFDDAGRAVFQYLVAPMPGGCRLRAPACVVVVRAEGGEVQAGARTVFGDSLPAPATVAVTPRTGIADGDPVTVTAEGFPPRSTAQVMLCIAPATAGREGCGAPGPVASVAIGADGAGTTSFTVRTGPVGRAGGECGRRGTCGIAVVPDGGAAVARVVPLAFSAGPGAGYDGARLAAGLTVAALLAFAALALVRTTDWTEPSEAATPEMDAASLEVEDVDLDDDDLVDA